MSLRPGALRRALGAVLAAMAIASAAPDSIAAQQVRTEGRNVSIAYQSGNATRNGYMDAQVQVTYYFAVCAGRVVFLARYNNVPHMLVGRHRYWVDGRQVEVPSHISPPTIASPTIRGTVRGNGIARPINYVYASSGTPSCLTNDLEVGPESQFWPAGTPNDRKLALLNGFGLDQQGTLPPLRNAEVESYFAQQFAAERTDSLNRARAAEQQRLQARRDSINRAQAAQAQRDSIARAQQQRATAGGSSAGTGAAGAAGTASGTAGTAGTATGTGTSGSSTGAVREPTVAEREAAAREAERLENERRAAEFRRQQEQAAERQRQQEAAAQAGAEAIVAVGTAVMPALESFFDGLEGTGFAMGFHAATSYLPGDAGRMGFGVGFIEPTTLTMWPFLDVSFELGTGEDFAMKTEGTLLTIGSPIPYVRWNFTQSVLRPHIGLTMMKSLDHEDPTALSVERQLLMLGLTWIRPTSGTALRVDATIWEGTARFGGGLWIIL